MWKRENFGETSLPLSPLSYIPMQWQVEEGALTLIISIELLYLSLLSRTWPTTRGERRTMWRAEGLVRLGGCERTRLPWELPTWREKTPGWGRRWRPVSQTWPGWPVWGTSWDREFLSMSEQRMAVFISQFRLFWLLTTIISYTPTNRIFTSCTNYNEYFRIKPPSWKEISIKGWRSTTSSKRSTCWTSCLRMMAMGAIKRRRNPLMSPRPP